MLDSQESVEILNKVQKDENKIWETLIEETKAAVTWILDAKRR